MHSTLDVRSKIRDYSVNFVSDLSKIVGYIQSPNTITFIDANVCRLYPELNLPNIVSVNCIEDEKTIEGADKIYSILNEKKANAKTRLIVIGGGILQDLVGFCASTYCRGIEYILVPTTLLAQADSCVGGKTSINFKNRKNILGTFYPPSEIIIYPNFTNTLSELDLISGFGEIYKFNILQNTITTFDINSDLSTMIHAGLKFKIDILQIDEFDRAERKYLNFGHTFGHALETASAHKIPHGIAVIIGSMIAVLVSKQLDYSVHNHDIILKKGIDLIRKSKVEIRPEWFDFDKLIEIVKADKKSTGKLTMVLIDNKPFLRDVEEYDILSSVLKEIYEII